MFDISSLIQNGIQNEEEDKQVYQKKFGNYKARYKEDAESDVELQKEMEKIKQLLYQYNLIGLQCLSEKNQNQTGNNLEKKCQKIEQQCIKGLARIYQYTQGFYQDRNENYDREGGVQKKKKGEEKGINQEIIIRIRYIQFEEKTIYKNNVDEHCVEGGMDEIYEENLRLEEIEEKLKNFQKLNKTQENI
ncbi:unnamed protein product [Paramecium pentaurelia]|uniref:Uncharacterized protein n=1 Tax=Paramecium pentaurelia TaxID=43138 RepID=A0A8S1UKT3_9CILI|nr:unnamed protein product [Paramecium pentaurelia]